MHNKIILITGGTSGIGKYISKKFLKEDNTLIIVSKSEESIKRTTKEFIDYKNKVTFIKADLSKEEQIQKAFNRINEITDKIDILINNAAGDKMSSIENYDYKDFAKIIKTNLLGKMFCIKNSIRLLKQADYPVIINIASRLAIKPMLNSSAYCCAASAIVMLTKCAALELENYGIRVNCISPSLTLTSLAKMSYSDEVIQKTAQLSTRKRNCEMKDIYELIKFLCSQESDYINGENINLNGGILLK